MATDPWAAVHARLKQDLEGQAKTAEILINFGADYDSFEASLNDLCKQYAENAGLIQGKIAPLFNHIQSFEKAIVSVTSNSQIAGFVWAGAQVLLEVSNILQVFEMNIH